MALSSTLPSRKRRDRQEARPVLVHARDALNEAERFSGLSEQPPDDDFESVIHGACCAMLHAARAACRGVIATAAPMVGRATPW